MTTFLNVPFADKDKAKALGARWHGAERKWYIPEGIEPAPFMAWLPRATAIAAGLLDKDEAEANEWALSDFMNQVAALCNPVLPPATWVRAEVADLKVRSALTSIELVEHDEEGRRRVSANVLIWSRQWREIDATLRAHGVALQAGMKVLIQLRADFDPQYGFRIVAHDIDPKFTLGEAEAKLNLIREALRKAGLYDRQKRLPRPQDFLHVAVISPENAAGLGDFRAEADKLAQLELCRFDYYSAVFQGASCAASVTQAFARVVQAIETGAQYDAIVIIRGGGAVSDMAWLNDLGIASAVAQAPVPVFAGIGHEKDNTIIDEVCHARFDTPSKVIQGIVSMIVSGAEGAREDMMMILKDVRRFLAESRTGLQAAMQVVAVEANRTTAQAGEGVRRFMGEIRAGADRTLAMSGQEVEALAREVLGLSPQNTLQRGYALIRDEAGRIVKKKADLKGEGALSVEFQDGRIMMDCRVREKDNV